MKRTKKLLSLVLALALAISVLAIPSVDAQAATKTTTYTYDEKAGIVYQTAFRCPVQNPYENESCTRVYFVNAGDYIASVKSSSKNLICKRTHKEQLLSESSSYSVPSEMTFDTEKNKLRTMYNIEVYAKKPGSYTLTLKINDKNNKTIATKKIKVYASSVSPIKEVKYAGQTYYYAYDVNTKKASGKLNIKMDKGYTLKKMEIGIADGTNINYKTIKNGANIKLAKKTVYKDVHYTYGDVKDLSSYYNESGANNDFLKPVTFVRVTYYDKLLKITKETSVNIINIK